MPANNVADLKPYLNQINTKDGPLALALWAHLTAGDMAKISADLTKAKSEGFTSQAAAIEQFIKTHKFVASSKSWATLQDEIDSAKGLTNAAVNSLNPLGGLFQANLWLRVAEVAIGVLLVGVGIAKLTNAIPAATKLAGAVGKLPIPV
jgi:hypothetical protein